MLNAPLALCAALLCAAPVTKVALVPLPAGEGVTEKSAVAISEAITGEIRRVPGVKLITQDEIKALLGLEQQKQFLGCTADSCMAELGGALGVDRLVTGSLNKVGETWMFGLKALDVKKAMVVAQSDRRVRKGTIDDMIDQIPAMVAELFGAAAVAGPVRTVEPPKADPARPEPAAPAPAPAAQAIKHPPATADVPVEAGTKIDDLKLVTDGKGLYLAFPADRDSTERVFVGDGKAFRALRIGGGSANGSEGTWSYNFWDPRIREGSGGGVDGQFEKAKGGKYVVTCGNRHETQRSFELKPVADKEAAKILKGAKFFQQPWRRQAYALVRDDDGNFFFLDEALGRPNGERDFRFWMGSKGDMKGYAIKDYLTDPGSEIFVTTAGRLKRTHATDKSPMEAEWVVGGQKTKVTWLDLPSQAQLVFTKLGVYAGDKPASPCDQVVR